MKSSTFTYSQHVEKVQATADVAKRLGYREEGKLWYVYRIPYLKISVKECFEDVGMQVYLPTYFVERIRNGRMIKEEKPKILNYLFVLADIEQINSLIAIENLRPMYRHRCEGEIFNERDKWQTIPSKQMYSLMIVAQGYEGEMEFCVPESQKLERGDKVRVVAGQYNGLEGVLIKSQGCKDGRIYVGITNGFGTFTTAISENCVKVLEFSSETNHFFRKIEAVEKLHTQAIERIKTGKELNDEMKSSLKSFLFRYSELGGLTHVSKAKLTACRYVAMRLLGRHQDAEACMNNFFTEVENDKNRRRALKRWPTAQKYIDKWVQAVDAVWSQMI
ncbi:MAG: hypothetical protein KBS94_06390 [Prevotella sp.]|nr:hypothetical protein [Candidatus Equicola faecalis]